VSLRDVPAVHRLLAEPEIAAFARALGPGAVKALIDDVLDEVRRDALRDRVAVPSGASVSAEIGARLRRLERAGLLEVINATGVLLHTNLGRAPLAPAALAAMAWAGGGYSNLEYDLEAGRRDSRYARVAGLLRETTGAEDALVVNNCAAAVLLVLDTFARGREVVVARGELIEIGGGFRLPDVLERSGATLIEAGASNRSYLSDVERALSPRTALLLRSHLSNFKLAGFTASIAPADLAALGRRVGIPAVEDLGSGAVVGLERYGLPHERTVSEAIRDGLDLVMFSGDKLLGGPQAGIVVGRRALIARLRANPLLRALRVDKATLAALAATLRLYLTPDAPEGIPLYAMLGRSLGTLRTRAEALAARLPARVVATNSVVGGGTLPEETLPSIGLALDVADPESVARRLRCGDPPVVGRIGDGKLLLDLRTIPPERDEEVARAVLRAVA
jgi:L-seryl-tRNA(Ser) seleniumtransferase